MKILVICLYLSMVFASAPASGRGRYDPMPAKHQGEHQGFLGWLFSRHNSQGADYGAKIEELRREVIDALRSRRFWAVVAPWGWVFVLLVRLYHQERIREQRLSISARLLARVHNLFVEARVQALEAIRKHNEVVVDMNHPRPAAAPPSRLVPPVAHTQQQALEIGNNPIVNPQSNRPPDRAQKEKKPAQEHQVTHVDYIAQINSIQAQLSAARETNKKQQDQSEKDKEEISRLRAEIERLNGQGHAFDQGNAI